MSKTTVLVGRKWKNPKIEITVNDVEIGIQMSLSEFLSALALEAGNPAVLFSVAALEKRLEAASKRVISGMKKETERL